MRFIKSVDAKEDRQREAQQTALGERAKNG